MSGHNHDHHGHHGHSHDMMDHDDHAHPVAEPESSSSAHSSIFHDSHEEHAMYFHGGSEEVILFDFWRISGVGGLIGSMVACFVMGVAFEGVKRLRDIVFARSVGVQPKEGREK